MEENKQMLLNKAKRLEIDPEIKQGVIRIIEFITKEEGRKLYIDKDFQSEFYLEYSNNQIIQTARNYDYAGNPTQKARAVMLVKDLPALYFQYQSQIDAALITGKRL
jgi:hypothetical protein